MNDPSDTGSSVLSGEAFLRDTLTQHHAATTEMQRDIGELRDRVGKLEGIYEGFTRGTRLTWIVIGGVFGLLAVNATIAFSIAQIVK